MEQLKALEQKLIESMAAKQKAMEADMFADKAFWEAVGEHPDLMALHELTVKSSLEAQTTKSDYAEAKTAAVKELMELTDPEDIKMIDACSYQLKKLPVLLPNDELVMRLVEANAFGLLLPDKKQIEKFVIDNAYKDDDDNYLLPEWIIRQYKRAIDVETVIKPTISDAKLTKAALK